MRTLLLKSLFARPVTMAAPSAADVELERTYAATPAPKWVVAVGDCGCGCGVFEGSYAVLGAVDKVIPVDLRIKGCPPRPIDLMRGLIALVDQATAKA